MPFRNAYEDAQFADHLAYRDLPGIIAEHVTGRTALDFGCGAGRSTRFLRRLGFEVVGIDIAADMLERARAIDPSGDYRLIRDGDLSQVDDCAFDLVLSAFTFDNIPTMTRKVTLFRGLSTLLTPGGRIVNLVSSPEIYTREWASFSTAAFPENRRARSGDIVRIINTAIEDSRPVQDVLWTDEAYRDVYARAGLAIVLIHKPLASGHEPYEWINETAIAPWVIYVLQRVDP
jgi:SAM-dependent methyltransferase